MLVWKEKEKSELPEEGSAKRRIMDFMSAALPGTRKRPFVRTRGIK